MSLMPYLMSYRQRRVEIELLSEISWNLEQSQQQVVVVKMIPQQSRRWRLFNRATVIVDASSIS